MVDSDKRMNDSATLFCLCGEGMPCASAHILAPSRDDGGRAASLADAGSVEGPAGEGSAEVMSECWAGVSDVSVGSSRRG